MTSGLEIIGGTVAAAQAPAIFVTYVQQGMKMLEFIKHEDEFLSELFDEIVDFCHVALCPPGGFATIDVSNLG